MDRILSTYSYGICLFSMEVLQDFLKKEKIRSKKLLHKFQKDKKLYLAMQKRRDLVSYFENKFGTTSY
ncbi:hypothetical protein [Roseburia intestinalis]